jgi:uncharacterized membrane protein YsdA (DUF1294 family)/cold shock CspA family protein
MRYQGRLTGWKDDKGYGFVTPDGGGQRAFIHIRSFANQQRRPVGNEIVTYEIAYDPMGRPQAESVEFHGERKRQPRRTQSSVRGKAPLLIGALFLLFLITATAANQMPLTVLAFYLAASLLAFIAYAMDKTAAQENRWRTQESTLHLFALIGGWPGAMAAQFLLNHKSKKTSFLWMFWLTVIMNCSALYWLLTGAGAHGLRTTIGFQVVPFGW